MMEGYDVLEWENFLNSLPPEIPDNAVNAEWSRAADSIKEKIIVLDDDPTGIQTVHSVPVYTSWDMETLKKVMDDRCNLVYILTNSRALIDTETEKLHREIARVLAAVSKQKGKGFILISRGDSTLRGHYPLETMTLYEEISKEYRVDGEIIIPFFLEGGRFTYNDIHYLKDGDVLVPVGQTEFALDNTFGYKSSDLKKWVEEKTKGAYPSEKVITITMEELRGRKDEEIVNKLLSIEKFNKVIVNAASYTDLKVFIICYVKALKMGKRFLFRSAASLVQVIGGIDPNPLLTREILYSKWKEVRTPGLVIIGSYVKKTTLQLEKLKDLSGFTWIEMDVNEAKDEIRFKNEIHRISAAMQAAFDAGNDVCVYTGRKYYKNAETVATREDNITISNRISQGLVDIVTGLKKMPGFLVAKGGITSSDIGVKALKVKRAIVMGQIQPGIPVWELGPESLSPGFPYVIFPGNVGKEDTLKIVVEILRGAWYERPR